MAQTAVPSVLHLGFMIPVGQQDIEANDLKATMRGGTYGLVVDAYGERILRYCCNRDANFSLGDIVSRVGNTNAALVVTASTGTTTRAGIVGAALTASDHIGNILYVQGNNDSAGAAPEGENSIIVSNTTGYVNINAARPFTTAVAASDILWIIGTFNTEFSVGLPTPDISMTVYGCVVGQSGISDNQYGWVQSWGYVPQCNYSSSGATIAQPLIVASTTAECLGQSSASLLNIIGYAPVAVTGSLNTATGKALAFLQLGFGAGPVSTVNS